MPSKSRKAKTSKGAPSSELPEYSAPPLNEVVIGIQFGQPPGYEQIRAGEVWNLFKRDYPNVEEQPPLAPVFETFGLPQSSQLNFGIVTGASHDRFWFVSEAKDELIQFQHDRILHNWRKVGDQTNEYPRFKTIIAKFETEIRKLDSYMAVLSEQHLKINQSEITYINHIPLDLDEGVVGCPVERWLTMLDIDKHGFEDFNCTFRRRILTSDGAPYARLNCQAAVGAGKPGSGSHKKRVIVLNLTFRGAPQGDTIEAAIEFLKTGHQMIVEFFTQITTQEAHSVWGRTR